eukprot:m.1366886 g.1366886  ORF g.1366886 m.1366886 type:complete len:106 (-) comp24952_c0_seq44:451-768(-)
MSQVSCYSVCFTELAFEYQPPLNKYLARPMRSQVPREAPHISFHQQKFNIWNQDHRLVGMASSLPCADALGRGGAEQYYLKALNATDVAVIARPHHANESWTNTI